MLELSNLFRNSGALPLPDLVAKLVVPGCDDVPFLQAVKSCEPTIEVWGRCHRDDRPVRLQHHDSKPKLCVWAQPGVAVSENALPPRCSRIQFWTTISSSSLCQVTKTLVALLMSINYGFLTNSRKHKNFKHKFIFYRPCYNFSRAFLRRWIDSFSFSFIFMIHISISFLPFFLLLLVTFHG